MKRNLTDDVKKYLGIPPYDVNSNFVRGDGYFAVDCHNLYGKEEFLDECKRVYTEWNELRNKYLNRKLS